MKNLYKYIKAYRDNTRQFMTNPEKYGPSLQNQLTMGFDVITEDDVENVKELKDTNE